MSARKKPKWSGNVCNESEQDKPGICKSLLVILAIALFFRIFLVIFPEVIHNDGTEYVRHARQVALGNWSGGKSPPLYPSLIALVQMITQDYEMAGIWISVIFGALIVLPIFYLGKELFDEEVGLVSSLLGVVHPFLYMSSGSVLTESTYHFLLSASVLFSWRAFRRGEFTSILLFSLFTTFAYLARPEAIGFLFIFSVWVLLIRPPVEKRTWAKKIGIVSTAILAFLAFSSPYLIQIRKETGKWGISKKVSVTIGSLSEEEDVPSIEIIRKRKGITLSSLLKNPFPVLAKVGTGFLESIYRFQQVYNPILFLLALLGWILLFKKKNSYSLRGSFFVMSYLIFFFGFVLPFFFITRRYTSQMISISIPWAAFGFLGLAEWLHRRWGRGVSLKRFSIFLLLFILIGLFVQGRVIHTRKHRFIEREAGMWMKEHLPRGARVMCKFPQEPFYAELPWVKMPLGSYEEILSIARNSKVQYLVVDEEIEKDSPGFLEKLKKEDLAPIRDFKGGDKSVAIFKVIYPTGM